MLLFKATSANISKVRKWLLKKYAASTFNVCPHKHFIQISGPPLEIHLEGDTKPRDFHTPVNVFIFIGE